MDLWQAVVLGVVEGITEFLPVSSTGHLTIAEQLLGLRVDDPGVTAFTAVVQLGAIAVVLVFLRSDVARLAVTWLRGLRDPAVRATSDHRLAWCVIAGFALRDPVAGSLRSPWVAAIALIAWSAVMVVAERVGGRLAVRRGEEHLTLRDALWIGAVQCVALVPGVSRSGATISAGLLRGLTRVTATRVSFFLSVPALVAAGAYEAASQAGAVASSVGWGPMAMGRSWRWWWPRLDGVAAAAGGPPPDHRVRGVPGRVGRGAARGAGHGGAVPGVSGARGRC